MNNEPIRRWIKELYVFNIKHNDPIKRLAVFNGKELQFTTLLGDWFYSAFVDPRYKKVQQYIDEYEPNY